MRQLAIWLLFSALVPWAGAQAQGAAAAPAGGASGSVAVAVAIAPVVAATAVTGAPAPASCLPADAAEAIALMHRTGGGIERVKLAARMPYLPLERRNDVLLFKPIEADARARLAYTVIVADTAVVPAIIAADQARTKRAGTEADTQKRAATLAARLALPEAATPSQRIDATQVTVEAATKASDFRAGESAEPKTLISFVPELQAPSTFDAAIKQRTSVYVIGCEPGASAPAVYGAYETFRTSASWGRLYAIGLCFLCYAAAALATFTIHRSQRMQGKAAAGLAHPVSGTNYASWLRHFDPVVLTAGNNGRGSATKLQILFFSLLILGVVFYIWMLTGRLTDLSTNLLLLMGISGVGATASAGTDLAKNRLAFENWAWLIKRKWLPEGGVAEANLAQWKDIVTTDGAFDVYRFQMVTFSILVGLALLGAGHELNDLSAFDLPPALLGILGLSQVVYVAGKLVAPPSISELDDQIEKLKGAEKQLRDAVDKANVNALPATAVLVSEDESIKAARVAHSDYLDTWDTTRTMFESTLGRHLLEGADEERPPFYISQLVHSVVRLPDGTVNQPYGPLDLAAAGGVAPYRWKVIGARALPPGLQIAPPAAGAAALTDQLSGTPTRVGTWTFTLQVVDSSAPAAAANSKEFVLTVR